MTYIMKTINRCFYVLLFCLLLIFNPASYAFASGQDILLIHSYHDKHRWTQFLNEGFNNAFQNDENVRLFHEYLDAKRAPSAEFKDVFLSYVKNKYSSANLNAILVSDDAALALIREKRADFFPDIPVVYLGINKVDQSLIDTPNMTGVFENRDIGRSIKDIKKMTGIDQIIVISDKSISGRSNLSKIKSIENDPDAPTTIHIVDDLKDDQIPVFFENVDPKTPILLIGQLISSKYRSALLNWNDGSKEISSWVKNPIFTIAITTLNHGATGAYELSGVKHAQVAAMLVKRVLNGETTASIKPITIAQSEWVFNWEKINNSYIDEKALPKNSLFINKEASFYQQYKAFVLIVSSVFVVSFLIIIMLLEINRRGKQTRKILADNELRYKDFSQAGASIFWEMDSQQNISYISGNTFELFYMEPEEIQGIKVSDIYQQEFVLEFPESNFLHLVQKQQPLDNLIFKIKQTSESLKVILINGIAVYNNKGMYKGYRGIVKEITQEHQLSEDLAYQATYDSLTKLINRNSFNIHLEHVVNAHSNTNQQSFLCFLDLDRFKVVNDTAGHLVGDTLLAKIAKIIQNNISSKDTLARLGGDEFGLILTNQSQKMAQEVCENIIDQVCDYQFVWNKRHFNVGLSIGMVPVNDQFTATELLSRADLSCYKAKDAGRSRVFIADSNNSDLYKEELQMGYIANISQVIEKNQFYLVKQVIKPLSTLNTKEHVEVLIRYKDSSGNQISPALFIPAAEKYGVIGLIDEWVVKNVFEQYDTYFPNGNTLVSINLSGMTLSNDLLRNKIKQLVLSSPINTDNICFEITETAAISQLSEVLSFIIEMKALGIKFALDDFGSGAASFVYLKNLPVDFLKIDGSLIKNIVEEKTGRAIVESIHTIAKVMNMKTIAEFVENQEIEDILNDIGIDYVQGYHIARPITC